MKITTRQYAHLAWLFESPFPPYFREIYCRGNSYASMKKVQDNLVEKGLVKIIRFNNEYYKRCLKEYDKNNNRYTKEDLQEDYEYSYQNIDKVWAYRKWMTHEEVVLEKHPPYVKDWRHKPYNCEYPSLTEEGVVAVIRKFGLKSDSKLVPYVPSSYLKNLDYHCVDYDDKWRVEWIANE